MNSVAFISDLLTTKNHIERTLIMLDEEYNKTRDINYKVRILVEIKERQKNIFIIDQKLMQYGYR